MAYIYPIPCRFWWGLGVGDRESEAHGDALYVHGIAQRTTEPSRHTPSADVGQKRQRGGGGGDSKTVRFNYNQECFPRSGSPPGGYIM